jgi:hypothetical protein
VIGRRVGNGTAIVLGGYLRYGRPTGLWTVVGRVGQRRQRVAKLSAEGAFPVVTAEGTSGAIAVFEPTGDTLSWVILPERTETFSKPLPVPDPKVSTAPIPAVLAANLKGQFVAAWNDFTRRQNPSYFLRASLGNGTTPSRSDTILPSGRTKIRTASRQALTATATPSSHGANSAVRSAAPATTGYSKPPTSTVSARLGSL